MTIPERAQMIFDLTMPLRDPTNTVPEIERHLRAAVADALREAASCAMKTADGQELVTAGWLRARAEEAERAQGIDDAFEARMKAGQELLDGLASDVKEVERG